MSIKFGIRPSVSPVVRPTLNIGFEISIEFISLMIPET
jgi:hypothetical protein